MNTAKEWADVYCCLEVPTSLEKLIKLVQEQAIDETVTACAINVVQGSMRKTWYKIEQELKSKL